MYVECYSTNAILSNITVFAIAVSVQCNAECRHFLCHHWEIICTLGACLQTLGAHKDVTFQHQICKAIWRLTEAQTCQRFPFPLATLQIMAKGIRNSEDRARNQPNQ